MFDFALPHIESMEALMEECWPGHWRRLEAQECGTLGSQYCAGWKLDLPPEFHQHPDVTFGWVLTDRDFPLTDIRVAVPQAASKSAPTWPHVEDAGLLCLKARPMDLDAPRRLALAVSDAVEVLSFDEDGRASEFRREFRSYWNRRTSSGHGSVRSIVSPGGQTRDIVYAIFQGKPIFADNEAQLRQWLSNIEASGRASRVTAVPTRLLKLQDALTPEQYPAVGSDVLALDAEGKLADLIKAPGFLPVLIEAATSTGPVFACSTLTCGSKELLVKGFRALHRVPHDRVLSVYSNRPVVNQEVTRHDASWVHGRDNNPALEVLQKKIVAVIGCGALGSELARLLAAAGIGHLHLVDSDKLKPENTSRHLLGASSTGKNKATALATALNQLYPHMRPATAASERFEKFGEADLAVLAGVDVLITAGLPVDVSVHVAQWRASHGIENPWMECWAEEFACAGHAVAMNTGAVVGDIVNEQGRRLQNLTSKWPANTATVMEAGCGTAFQPYNATDLWGTTNMSVRLALDLLLGNSQAPAHWMWFGDRSIPLKIGATLDEAFDNSFLERRS